ncbi:MAG: S1 RNA-binding domain-containing protein [Chloroflexi bacterium]|nr:S1 RNA-binding domain-containing protein [Chloroflexota bacterium]
MVAIEPRRGLRQNEGAIGWLPEERALPSLRWGQILEGTVARVDRDGILVDIGAKTEGFVPSPEMHTLAAEELTRIKVGDGILVYSLGRENAEGQPILSVDRAIGERTWHQLQRAFEAGEAVESRVVDYNRGGLLVDIRGASGFVPQSQMLPRPGESGMEARMGETLQLKILEMDRRRNRLILSEREMALEMRAQRRERLIAEVKEGEVRRGRVSSLHPFGAFVDLGGADGLVPISELSWDRVASPDQVVKVGDEVEVYVMRVDTEAKKIALSLRRAQTQPWDTFLERYEEGQLVRGVITRVTAFGAFARLDDIVEGLIHISELADKRVQHPKEVVKEGDFLTLKIVSINRERKRLGLSLRQAPSTGSGQALDEEIMTPPSEEVGLG